MNITLEAEEFWEAFCDHNADLYKEELYFQVVLLNLRTNDQEIQMYHSQMNLRYRGDLSLNKQIRQIQI